MIEIPESKTISLQASGALKNKRITQVVNATSPHKFAFYHGDPSEYGILLKGRQVLSTNGHGMFVDIIMDEQVTLTLSEGTNLRYYSSSAESPVKHQLLIAFDDDSCVAFTVAMYGGISAYRGILENPYYRRSIESISPLDDRFNESFFDLLLKNTSRDLSLKAFLATEQRIPGLGNGVLQDILFNAGLNPRRKKSTLSDSKKADLFKSLKSTLVRMAECGGRDTERDFYGNPGGYKTILSKNTFTDPCPNCGGSIRKEAYLGGAVYFCPSCQKL
jgi:formamidopyrimidine-DNA glycosylase